MAINQQEYLEAISTQENTGRRLRLAEDSTECESATVFLGRHPPSKDLLQVAMYADEIKEWVANAPDVQVL